MTYWGGRSDLSNRLIFQVRSSDQGLPVTARRAKRENGGLGACPQERSIVYFQVIPFGSLRSNLFHLRTNPANEWSSKKGHDEGEPQKRATRGPRPPTG
jgi:hypothetical protein